MAYRRHITTAACAFAATVAAFGTALNDLPGTAEVYTASETDAAIRRLAPEPGNYLEVSNRAMSAIQTLAPATGYVDSVTQDLRAFAGSNAVTRLITPDGLAWQDATGVVWRVEDALGPWTATTNSVAFGDWYQAQPDMDPDLYAIYFTVDGTNAYTYTGAPGNRTNEYVDTWWWSDGQEWPTFPFSFIRNPIPGGATNAVRQVAYTNDIPSTNGLASAAALGELSSRVLAVEQGEIPSLYIKIIESNTAATNYTDAATNALAEGPIRDVQIATEGLGSRIAGLESYAATKTELSAAALASTNYTDASISTNNAAFVAAVLAAPIVGASPSDLADIAEYGSYGTVGAAILALIAGLAALKRDKANKTDLPYPFNPVTLTNSAAILQDRAVNTLTVAADCTLTLPAVNANGARDLLLRMNVSFVSDTTLPQIAINLPSGETGCAFETDGDSFPAPDAEGVWCYSFTETAVHKFAVSLKSLTTVVQTALGGS